MRLIHAVRELNCQRAEPMTLIALYTAAERDAMFVREADEAVCLGPGIADVPGAAHPEPYLDYARLEARAAWRGRRRGLGGLGLRRRARPSSPSCASGSASPSSARRPTVMRRLGDKIGAKRLAEEAGRAGRAVERRPGRDARRGAARTRRASATR